MIDLDGVIHYAPNVPGFRRVPVRAELAAATGLPTIVDNDANTAAYAEIKIGVAKGVQDALVITLGTGIGGGVIVGGRVLRGANGFAAEIGHFQIDPAGPMCACGEPGHWEAAASGNALGQMARDAAAAGDAPSVLEQAGGDVDAIVGHHVSAAAHTGRRGRARARRPLQLQRRDRPRRPRQHLRSRGDRDRRWPGQRRRAVPRPDPHPLLRPPRGLDLPADAGDRPDRGGGEVRRHRRRPARAGLRGHRVRAGEGRAHAAVVRRGPGGPARRGPGGRGRGRPRGLRVRPPVPHRRRRQTSGPRSSALRCSARSRPRPGASRSARSWRA